MLNTLSIVPTALGKICLVSGDFFQAKRLVPPENGAIRLRMILGKIHNACPFRRDEAIEVNVLFE